MRKINFVLFMCFIGTLVHAQNRDFDGIWTGKLTTSAGNTLDVTLYIEDNNVYNVGVDEDGDRIKLTDKNVSWSKGYGEQLNYVWMNKGGVWTETQAYFMVWSNKDTLSVYFTRHVSNESEEFDGNTDWGYTAEGYLHRE